MKKITARITMSVNVTDDVFDKIINKSKEDDNYYDDVEITDSLMELFKANGYIDEDYGDSYIPGPWIECFEEE